MSVSNTRFGSYRGFNLLEIVFAMGFFALIVSAIAGLWSIMLVRLELTQLKREALHVAELFGTYTMCNPDFKLDSSTQTWSYNPSKNKESFFEEDFGNDLSRNWSVQLVSPLYIPSSEITCIALRELQVRKQGKILFQTLYGQTFPTSGF